MKGYIVKDQGYYLRFTSASGNLDEWSILQSEALRFEREVAVKIIQIREANATSYPRLVRLVSTSARPPEKP